ncbi:outer membrane beta-barrel protein [Aeromonas rivipollensis]|uniref:outer membrane beta-barrel protein n=1 Tax=Aeromonas rivipollensis TaxID=948519 RepID=UPI003D1A3481
MIIKIPVVCMATMMLITKVHAVPQPFYIGVKSGWVHAHNACEPSRLTCDNNELGAGLYAGYFLTPQLSFEAGYDYFGKIKAMYKSLGAPERSAPYQGKVQGVSASLKYNLAQINNLSLFAKAGGMAWRTDVKGQEVYFQHQAHDTGLSPLLGTGLEYSLSDKWKGQLEYQWINDVGGGNAGGSSLNTLYAGLSFHW